MTIIIWVVFDLKQVSKAGTNSYIPQHLWDAIVCPCPCEVWIDRQLRRANNNWNKDLLRGMPWVTCGFPSQKDNIMPQAITSLRHTKISLV